MGIKGVDHERVYGKRDLSPLAGMDKKQAGGKVEIPRGNPFNKGGKPDARKRK
jgi:small subunit ribosomal protein S3